MVIRQRLLAAVGAAVRRQRRTNFQGALASDEVRREWKEIMAAQAYERLVEATVQRERLLERTKVVKAEINNSKTQQAELGRLILQVKKAAAVEAQQEAREEARAEKLERETLPTTKAAKKHDERIKLCEQKLAQAEEEMDDLLSQATGAREQQEKRRDEEKELFEFLDLPEVGEMITNAAPATKMEKKMAEAEMKVRKYQDMLKVLIQEKIRYLQGITTKKIEKAELEGKTRGVSLKRLGTLEKRKETLEQNAVRQQEALRKLQAKLEIEDGKVGEVKVRMDSLWSSMEESGGVSDGLSAVMSHNARARKKEIRKRPKKKR
eukprot:Hpha_TRINITY_DN23371_c0_g1::TRINITY_DN23371_c0_g1_i1::g.96957::m.96957